MKLWRKLPYPTAVILLAALLGGPGAGAQAAPAERHLGRISTVNWATADLNLYMYGVYGVGLTGAMFNPSVIPPNVKQVVTPYIRIPDGDLHRYRLDCDLRGDGPAGTTTRYRLADRDDTTVATATEPQGSATVSFEVTADLDGPHSQFWLLTNVSGHPWLFVGCDVYEILS